jgi:hypothetical protein
MRTQTCEGKSADAAYPTPRGVCGKDHRIAIHEEITARTKGALFRRGDLHIHSFGTLGSYAVVDTTMTPEAIVDTGLSGQLQVIAITDHNSIGNVRKALAHGAGMSLLAVPGAELSTPLTISMIVMTESVRMP